MEACEECVSFISGGTVPAGKDGSCIWSELDPKGGKITLSRPVTKLEFCKMFTPKQGVTSKKGGA